MSNFLEAVSPDGAVQYAGDSEHDALESLRGMGGTIVDAKTSRVLKRFDAGAIDRILDSMEDDGVAATSMDIAPEPLPSLFDTLSLRSHSVEESPADEPAPMISASVDAVVLASACLLGPLLQRGVQEDTAIEESVTLAQRLMHRVKTGALTPRTNVPMKDANGRPLVQEVDERTGQVRGYKKINVGGRTVIQRHE